MTALLAMDGMRGLPVARPSSSPPALVVPRREALTALALDTRGYDQDDRAADAPRRLPRALDSVACDEPPLAARIGEKEFEHDAP
jgi:hypothetical protein